MEWNRRNFIKNISALGLLSTAYPLLTSFENESNLDFLKEKISKIELYRYDIDIPRYFSWGTWFNRQHLFMKISSGNYYGWSEIPASTNNPDFQPTQLVEYLKTFKNLTIDKAQKLLSTQQVLGTTSSTKWMEFVEMGLLDLSGKMQKKSVIELLDLKQRAAVPGLYCILEKDVEKARIEAQNSMSQNLAHHVKFKMYGEQELDLNILKAVRETIGKSAFVTADVNEGYKTWKSLDELATIMVDFRNNGLNAIEDPAVMTTNQWVELQAKVGELSLIADIPMRPAWQGLKTIKPGMIKIFNLHPSTMGSFRHTALLAKKIKELGFDVLVGDDSLAGPACSAWQQIAIGAGAICVEAIEKSEDSKNYLNCLISTPTKKDNNGYFSLDLVPGFGVEIDTNQLKKVCKLYIEVA